ncbi:capsule polysaccharide synthase Cps1 [Pyrenophora seminiperda CCB06]|uniref:Capsule polysaccharide synthase Cps1 n=1 Tax=Pyrenophora seminiperda CCB06 TaxID=1302712 RepID=A0A3M7M7E1_9PLEO|nr:capsule polysaccharide synthase Cps1 [Pyrenophora seminiperda CCB06]
MYSLRGIKMLSLRHGLLWQTHTFTVFAIVNSRTMSVSTDNPEQSLQELNSDMIQVSGPLHDLDDASHSTPEPITSKPNYQACDLNASKTVKTAKTYAIANFCVSFTIVPALWFWWLSTFETKSVLASGSTWGYHLAQSIHHVNQALFLVTLLWVAYLMLAKPEPIKGPACLARRMWYLFHLVPMICYYATAEKLLVVKDLPILLYTALEVSRRFRTIVGLVFWFQYKPALPQPRHLSKTRTQSTTGDLFSAQDCTVIVPTVGPSEDNPAFDEMVCAILLNKLKRVIFSTNTEAAKEATEAKVKDLLKQLAAGDTTYQKEHRAKYLLHKNWMKYEAALTFDPAATHLVCENANISNKRQQFIKVVGAVETNIVVSTDDTAIWHPLFSHATLPAFNEDNVGLVGTRKWVKRLLYAWNEKYGYTRSIAHFCAFRIWNMVGALYLIRHNFDISAFWTSDGGLFGVSGRACFIKTDIVQDPDFQTKFLNERAFRTVDYFRSHQAKWWYMQSIAYLFTLQGTAPLMSDDDNFITRWVIAHTKYTIRIQYSPEATMTTVLGGLKASTPSSTLWDDITPHKFPSQCVRWARTTFRQNPIALLDDQTIWWLTPLSVWTVYFPWMYNFALFWDGLAVTTYTFTSWYNDYGLWPLLLLIWSSKLVKTLPWFWEHPTDLVFFVVPVYHVLVYCHSLLKGYALWTVMDTAWSGRKNLPNAQPQTQQDAKKHD